MSSLCLIVEALDAIGEARMADAFGLIDEAMLTVLADESRSNGPVDIFCLVLHHCYRLADLARMRAWTPSMERWCENFAAVTYGGVCEMHPLHLLTSTEDYRQVENQLFATSRKLEGINPFAAADGFYELGEIRRLRGDVAGASPHSLGAVARRRTATRRGTCTASARRQRGRVDRAAGIVSMAGPGGPDALVVRRSRGCAGPRQRG